MQRASYQELVRGGANFTFEVLHQDPELLDWFLRNRGFRTGAGVENRKILFLFVRLDLHQANHVAYREGRLAEELWPEWLTTLRLDLAIREFAPVNTIALTSRCGRRMIGPCPWKTPIARTWKLSTTAASTNSSDSCTTP